MITGVEDGVLTVGMECAYAPYNWTQMDDSNGAVPIANNPGAYANGYDVMIAKKICEANGWELEVMAIGWDGLVPALNAGQLDAVIYNTGDYVTIRFADGEGTILTADSAERTAAPVQPVQPQEPAESDAAA